MNASRFVTPLKLGAAVALGALIFLPRLLNLADFINIDACLHWEWRSAWFWDRFVGRTPHDTYLSAHPGVTIMLASGVATRIGALIEYGTWNPWDHFADLLFYAKLPIALITGCGVVLVYLILKRYGREPWLAVLAAFYLAVDPFFLAHSRYLHLDAIHATFVLLCLMTAAVYLLEKEVKWLWISGVLFGLAFLTRSSSLALLPYVLGSLVCARLCGRRRDLKRLIKHGAAWLAIGAGVFVALWPAMWVMPLQTLRLVIDGARSAATTPHVAPGQDAVQEAAPAFFDTSLLQDLLVYRSPVILALGIVGAAALIYRGVRGRAGRSEFLLAYTALFGLLLIVGLSLFAKVATRYVLVSFVAFQIVGAYGLFVSARTIAERVPRQWGFAVVVTGALLVCAADAYQVLRLHPYYQSYHGSLRAPDLYGWGEGLEKIGEYLDAKANPQELKVASFYSCVLNRYMRGEAVELDSLEDGASDIDYVVLYDSQVQRNLFAEVTRDYELVAAADPEFIAVINGVEYAWLYPTRSSFEPEGGSSGLGTPER
jgi:hypothetical protein